MEQDEDDCRLFGKIVVLADSISEYGYSHATHGWLGFLADEWAGRADVVLRGFPGYNTHWVRSIFPDLLQQESKSSGSVPAKLVLIALGTDDASFPRTRQHVAVDAYKDNLKSLISSIRYPESPSYSPDTQIILVTPAPMDDTMWEASLTAVNQTLDRSNSVTKEYVDACLEVGNDLKVPVVDIWSDIQCQVDGTCELHESDQLQDYLMDGFHLRRMGNEVLYKGIMNAVAKHYPFLHPTCWPIVFPGYSSESSPEQSVLKRHCSSNHY
ncbi:SGNH hydrolase-type esterase domain-containing protein [Dissophora ornata]|nr:SGNH hydrolase-type esterase domain-containing protein [Dissophora ornata]